MTLRDFLNGALLKINVIDVGGNADDEDMNFAFDTLNDILDQNKARTSMMFELKRQLLNTVANQASYQVGAGAEWNISRPQKILRAGFVNTYLNPTDPLETPMHVFTDEEWSQVALKSLTNSVCWALWYESNFTDPDGYAHAYPYPVPSVAAKVALYVPTPMGEQTDLDATISFAPGYRKYLKCAVAVCACESFEREPGPILLRELSEATKIVERANAKPMSLRMPRMLVRRMNRGGGFNILTDQ